MSAAEDTPIQTTHSASQAVAARALFARLSKRSARIVVPINEGAANPGSHGAALFCIHSIVGGGMADFLPLARQLGNTVPTFGIQAPPQQMEDPSFGASLQALAETYAAAVVEAQPSGPIVVAGWSAGAAVALEVGHSLRARGRDVALLVAIDGAPENVCVGLRPWDPRYWLGVAANLPLWFVAGREMEKGFPATAILRWSRSVLSRSSAASHSPPVAPRLARLVNMDRYPPAQRQFIVRLYDAIMGYVPRPWDGPVAVYEAQAVLSLPQYLERWRAFAPLAERAVLPGNHVTIMREPQVASFARDLENRIANAVAAAPGRTAQLGQH